MGSSCAADLAAHYDTAILPARPCRPRDKAKVEVGVQFVQRWIVAPKMRRASLWRASGATRAPVARLRCDARLRGRQCVSLAELNAAIRELLEAFNGTMTRHPSASRQELFETPDRPVLKPLPAEPAEPAEPYEDAEWVERRRARIDPEEQPVSSPARPARPFRRLCANTHRPMGGAGDHPSDHPLHSLTLDGMAEAFADLRGREDRGDFSHAEWLGRLIDREATSHSTKTFPTPMRAARLCRVRACSEEVDCRAPASATGRRFRTSPPSGRSMSAATC